MLTVNDINPDQKLSVLIAVTSAKKVLPVYEAKYPGDLRPRKAIEAAEEYIRDPTATSADAAHAAANAAYAAANAANAAAAAAADAAANAAAHAAANAAYAAANAAYAAAANAAANAARAAAWVAYANANAARAAGIDKDVYIHNQLLELLPDILKYKLENQQSFGDAEKVLEYLTEDQVDSYLFNLDILV